MRAAVVVFPGSNCDHDTLHVLNRVAGMDARPVWHMEHSFGVRGGTRGLRPWLQYGSPHGRRQPNL